MNISCHSFVPDALDINYIQGSDYYSRIRFNYLGTQEKNGTYRIFPNNSWKYRYVKFYPNASSALLLNTNTFNKFPYVFAVTLPYPYPLLVY